MTEHRKAVLGTAISGLGALAVLTALLYGLGTGPFSKARDRGTAEGVTTGADPAGFDELAADGTRGRAIYDRACTACHATGAADAPRLDDTAAWGSRLAQGMDSLLQTLIDGKGAMPPRGTCRDCSDEDLKAAIEYMLGRIGSGTSFTRNPSGTASRP